MPEYVVPVPELEVIARAIAIDRDTLVRVGPPGSGWFIHSETGVINADGGDLLAEHPDDVRGLVCHEAAHAAVTRYLHFVPRALITRPGIASLLNAMEDCRIEDWLARRYPGTAAWIDRYNNRLFPEETVDLRGRAWFEQFHLGAIFEWWHGHLPPVDGAPREALERTCDARARLVAALPPVSAAIPISDALAYDRSAVAEAFRTRDRYAPPDAFERMVRLSAYAAHRICWLEIRPVYEDLIARDADARDRMRELEQRFLEQLRELRNPGPARSGRRPFTPPSDLPTLPPPPEEEAELPELSAEERARLHAAAHGTGLGPYEAARREVASLSDPLVDRLELVLRPDAFPRWVGGHPSGARVDLRVAMRAETEPGVYLQMWQRKSLPHKRDPAFALALDLSGSMRGPRIQHGFRGVVLLGEVLSRIGVPFAVFGFQDVPIRFKGFSEPLDGDRRDAVGRMPEEVQGRRPGGRNKPEHNWDGPALRDIATELLAFPCTTRVLVVVSDGEPSGPGNHGDDALHRTIRWIRGTDVHLIGLGLGPDTAHVLEYYRDGLANVPLSDFPAVLAARVEALVGGA